jgi:DHA2 family methylenomycin A resistance protein-like MFS transporter
MSHSVAPLTPADLRVPGDRGVVALVGICLGFFVVLLDATIVNVSLPAIGSALGGSLSDQQWILNAYTLTFAAFMLNAGALADCWGARRGYLGGLAIFVVATVACACAPTGGVDRGPCHAGNRRGGAGAVFVGADRTAFRRVAPAPARWEQGAGSRASVWPPALSLAEYWLTRSAGVPCSSSPSPSRSSPPS